MRRTLILVLFALVSGCIPRPVQEAERYFVLQPAQAADAATARVLALRVAPTSAERFYDTTHIIYSRSPGIRNYYQFSYWTERPQHAVHAALLQRIAPAPDAGRWMLTTQVNEIYHEAAQLPGTVILSVTAEVLERGRNAPATSRTFRRSVAAPTGDAAGAAEAARQAIGLTADDIAAWAAREVPRLR